MYAGSLGKLALAVVALAAVSGASSLAHAGDEVDWDTGGAKATGSGCELWQDTHVVSAGADLAVLFTNMGVELPPNQGPNADNTHCRIQVPFSTAGSIFIEDLAQQVLYGWSKNGDVEGRISARTKFLGRPLPPLEVWIGPDSAQVASFRVLGRIDEVAVPPGWCRRRFPKGKLHIDLRVFSKRTDGDDSLSVRILGEDLRYEATALWARCE